MELLSDGIRSNNMDDINIDTSHNIQFKQNVELFAAIDKIYSEMHEPITKDDKQSIPNRKLEFSELRKLLENHMSVLDKQCKG